MTPERIATIRTDLLAYNEYIFQARKGAPMRRNQHQDLICTALERVVAGLCPRLIINISPRAGKTELAVINFISWCMGNFPESHFIHASYSKTLAANNTYAVRSIMQMGEYRAVFGHSALMNDSRAKDHFQTSHGGVVYAAGTGGTITGFGAGGMTDGFAGAIIIDDAAKAGEGDSDTMRKNVIDWYSNTMESRRNNPDTPVIIIQQRLHENDLAGWLLDGGNGEQWELLKIPAIDESGASFWPEQFPIDMLERMQGANPYVFAGQYMQEPAPLGGGDFKTDNIQIIDALPAGLSFVRGWDLAGTTKKTSDHTASVKMAIKDGITYIAEAIQFKGGPDEVERRIVQTASLDGKNTFSSYPQDPGQAGVAQARTISRLLAGQRFEFTTESGDKRLRASPFAAQVNAGNVRMLKAPWNTEYLHTLGVFPNGKHDDLVDASSRAYNRINASTYTWSGF